MNHLIIGYGEIGQAIDEVISAQPGATVTVCDFEYDLSVDDFYDVDVMHICFPYDDGFVIAVKQYIEIHSPSHVIIYSTLPIGTTEDIGHSMVHSPIEGKHPDLALSIQTMDRWIASKDFAELEFFTKMFLSLDIKTKIIGDPSYTEALKLLSTTEYGLNIEFARYKKHVADSIGMDYDLVKQWNQTYNKLYKDLGLGNKFHRYVLDPPEGPKGGHCVTPNALLLDKQYPNDMVKIVGELL